MPLDQPELENRATESRKILASVVTTLFNEADNVEPMTRNLISTFKAICPDSPFELVLVLNGPTDSTPEKARELSREFPEITLVRLESNQGYGGGIRAGLACAKGEYVGFTDADEQISSEDTARVFSFAFAADADLVKAVRTAREDGWKRLLITTVYNNLFRIMFGVTNPDINGKPKVFKRQVLERFDLKANDWFIDAEIMIQSKRMKLSIKEVPISFKARARGNSNVRVSTILEFLRNMWKYRNEQH